MKLTLSAILLFTILSLYSQETRITPWGIKDNSLGNISGIRDNSLGMLNNIVKDSTIIIQNTGVKYASINAAINAAIDGYTILIGRGIYNEKIDLTAKRLNFKGYGNRETVIYYTEPIQYPPISTITLGTNCVFNNISFRKHNNNTGYRKEIIYISNCNPLFINCEVKSLSSIDNQCDCMDIENNSNVTMTNCSIDCQAQYGSSLWIKNTSHFTFTGTTFKAFLRTKNNSITNIICNDFWTAPDGVNPTLENKSKVELTVNVQHHAYNTNNNSELDAGTNIAYIAYLLDSCTFNLHGNLAGPLSIVGDSITCLLKDAFSTKGKIHIAGGRGLTPPEYYATANNTTLTIDHSNLYFQYADTVSGLHIIEDYYGWHRINIINGSILEFAGRDGTYKTWGQPISVQATGGTLYIKDSQVIHHVNQPAGYRMLISACTAVELDNVILSNVNWDHGDTHFAIMMNAKNSNTMTLKLKDVTFNGAVGSGPIYLYQWPGTFGSDDYICVDGITNNTGQPMSDMMTLYNTLVSHCP